MAIHEPSCVGPRPQREGAISAASRKNDGVRIHFRRPQLPLLVASLVIASCLVAIGIGVSIAVTGRDQQGLPDVIEEIDPTRSASQVPSQTQVFVDLRVGYTGVLVVDGLELETIDLDQVRGGAKPGQQITLPPTTIFEPGNATLTFDPSPDSTISEFSQGEHIVKVIYWKVLEGRGRARSYTWSFTVF